MVHLRPFNNYLRRPHGVMVVSHVAEDSDDGIAYDINRNIDKRSIVNR